MNNPVKGDYIVVTWFDTVSASKNEEIIKEVEFENHFAELITPGFFVKYTQSYLIMLRNMPSKNNIIELAGYDYFCIPKGCIKKVVILNEHRDQKQN